MRVVYIGTAIAVLGWGCAHGKHEAERAHSEDHSHAVARADGQGHGHHARAHDGSSDSERGAGGERNAQGDAPQNSASSTPAHARSEASQAENAPPSADAYGARADNTRVNERDRENSALTPLDQSESEDDRELTRRIRGAAVADSSLSFTAKNVKIITRNGQVTLRGPVNNARERDTLDRIARTAAGPARVTDELEIVE